MKSTLQLDGLLKPGQAKKWVDSKRRAIRIAVEQGMKDGGKVLAEAARSEMQRAFQVKKPAFAKSMRAKIFNAKHDKLPSLLIGSKIDWLGIHVKGGNVKSATGGKMLIPLTEEGKRMGRKAFKRIVDALIKSGNAFFIQKGGKAILMAENINENSKELTRFKRAERQRSGQPRIKRGQEIPVAVLVPVVKLRARLDLAGVVRANLSTLTAAIEKRLANA